MEVSNSRRRALRKPGHRISALATDEHHSVIVPSLRVTGTSLSLGFGVPEKWVLPLCPFGNCAPPSFKFSLDRERRRSNASIRTKLTLHETPLVMSLVCFVPNGYSTSLQSSQYGRIRSRVSVCSCTADAVMTALGYKLLGSMAHSAETSRCHHM
jgi:hypothetical protein